MHMELPCSEDHLYLNSTWTGLFQELILYTGNVYQIEAEVERLVPDSTKYPTIINIYAYKPGSPDSPPVWLGSVDYKFNRSDRHIYSRRIKPTETAVYQIVFRLFGWGNEGKPVMVNVDNIKVVRIN